jgi:hypothetical protein
MLLAAAHCCCYAVYFYLLDKRLCGLHMLQYRS